jgi:ATP-dependent helicase/nuclease subunit A
MSETPQGNPITFTKAQCQAIDVAKPWRDTCVVAGPGSGKTTVLVELFKRLVETGTDPLRILAITFTEKAAGNMRAKLAAAFQQDPATRARLERAWVSTVHGFCARLLKENAVFAGIDPQFTVADARQSWRMQQESMAAAMESLFEEWPEAVRALIRGLSSIEFEQAVLSAYDAMRGAGVRVEELAAFPAPDGITLAHIRETLELLRREPCTTWSGPQRQYRDEILENTERLANARSPLEALKLLEEFTIKLNSCKRSTGGYLLVKRLQTERKDLQYTLITDHYRPQRELLLEILRRFDALYRQAKRQAGALDFSDLEEFAVRLLEEQPEIRERVRRQFDRVLMDEFQDTNGQQAKLLELVRAPDRFYAVGDINQSIFGFRHAEPDGFSEYRNQIAARGACLVELEENFRSRAGILRAVETIMDGADGIVTRRLIPERQFPAQSEDAPPAVELIATLAGDAAAALGVEAQWVARRIVELTAGGAAFQGMAVLVRNTEVMGDFTAAFDQAHIPYVVNQGRGFYESREVVDLTHLLRVIANPRDEISLAAVLRSPLVEVSDEALLRLRTHDYNIGSALHGLTQGDTEFAADDLRKLAAFRERLREWRARREYVTFDRLLAAAVDDCGYRPESPGNLDKFLAEARGAAGRMSLDEFVAELEMIRDENPREADAPPDDAAGAVKIMTVHSAKGLEFPIVFVAALQKGVEGKPPVVAFSRYTGLGARWRNPATQGRGRGDEKDDLYQHAIREERSRREGEEANRLLYVAMTRAEERLVLSLSSTGKKIGNWAGHVVEKLGVDVAAPSDGVVTQNNPYLEDWKLRVLVADRAPELLTAPAAAQADRRSAEPEWLPRPKVTEQHDGNTTVTALADFSKCPRRYFVGHYLGFSGRSHAARPVDETVRELPANEFGTLVHQLLAGNGPEADADPEALRLAGVFHSGPLGRRIPGASRVEREFDFLLSLGGMVIRGQVDLWFEEAGRIEIVDYKTDSVSAAEAAQRAQDYALQLRIYAMAIERLTGRAPQRAWLHFLRPNSVVEVDLGPSLLDAPEQIVAEFMEAQDRMDFPLREGGHCPRCPYYKSLCPAGQ